MFLVSYSWQPYLKKKSALKERGGKKLHINIWGTVVWVLGMGSELQHVSALKHKACCHFNLPVPEGPHKNQGR